MYKITHNPKYNNFLISPDYIKERELKFVYKDPQGNTIEKIIPLEYLGPNLRSFRLKDKWDPELEIYKYMGYVYFVNEKLIYDY